MKIGIVGNGYVGKATALLACKDIDVLIWDINKDLRNINDFEDLSYCDFVFVCVPTPMNENGSCNAEIVKNVAYDLMALEIKGQDIVVRSTVPVGTCKSLGLSFMPEFLTEADWEEDFKSASTRVIGMPNPKDQALSGKFLNLFYAAETHKKINESEYLFCSTREAETMKLARNSFLAVKVSFFNEIYSFCEKLDIDYATVADMIAVDERIGASHTRVPGPDGKRGFGGTCFPKDINSLIYQLNKNQIIASVMGGAKYRNENLDRPEKDWEEDKGRSVI
ncbi:hypothetical protein CL634_00130 [bacterium]|nr:hypothetical protein [bacterium]